MIRKYFWIIVILGAIIFVIAAFFTGNIPFVGQQQGTAPAAPTPVAGNQLASVGIGKAVGYGDWGYRVASLERRDKFEQADKQAVPAGVFLVINLTVTNNGKEPRSLSATDFALIDSQGRRYGVDGEATELAAGVLNKNRRLGIAVQPGLTKDSAVVFDIPRDAKGLSFRLFQGYLDVDLGQ